MTLADFFSRTARLLREVLIDTARRHFGLLEPKICQVVDLHWYQDLTHQETAAILEIAKPTVRRYWVAARVIFQEKFQDGPFNWKPLGG